MNKKIFSFIAIAAILIIIIFFRFGNKTIYKNYNYAGGGKSWSAEYNIKSVEKFTLTNKLSSIISNSSKTRSYEYDSKVTRIFSITYKGDSKDLLGKDLFFEYKGKTSKGTLEEPNLDTVPEDKTFRIQSIGRGISIEDKDSKIDVFIKVDDKIERMVLKPVY